MPSNPAPKAVSYCVVCDALPGECAHDGPRYLDPIVYERVEAEEGRPAMWRVPDHERERVDNPPRTWASISSPPTVDDVDQNPFRCADCGAPLSPLARLRGFVRCYRCDHKDGA